jgi:hypothetical protein
MSPLLTTAREIIRTLFHACGEPQAIASQGYISAKLYDLFLTWIRAGETLLRRVLLIEAYALAPVPPASSRQLSPRTPRKRQLVAFYPDKPDDWRVSFHCAVPMERRRPRRPSPAHAGETPALHIFSTWPLALRAEALLRVCNNPAPYIARLARAIARIPKLIARICKPPHKRKRKSGDPPHIEDIIGREAWARIEAASPDTS